MTDYAACNRKFRAQKAALTRAVNAKDPAKVLAACRKAVNEWQAEPFNGMWPDDWARWQRALDDCFRVFHSPDLRDLRFDGTSEEPYTGFSSDYDDD